MQPEGYSVREFYCVLRSLCAPTLVVGMLLTQSRENHNSCAQLQLYETSAAGVRNYSNYDLRPQTSDAAAGQQGGEGTGDNKQWLS